jgi:hypothetical protein
VTTASWARAWRARGSGWGDSNSSPPSEVLPGGRGVGGLTCGSLIPVVTAGDRCSPPSTNLVCTHRVPVASGPGSEAVSVGLGLGPYPAEEADALAL